MKKSWNILEKREEYFGKHEHLRFSLLTFPNILCGSGNSIKRQLVAFQKCKELGLVEKLKELR